MKKIIALFIIIFSVVSCDRESVNGGPGFVPDNTNFNFDSRLPSNLETNPEVNARVEQMRSLTLACGSLMNSLRSNRVTSLSSTNSDLPNSYTWSSGGYVIIYNYGIVGDNYEFEYTITIDGNPYFDATGWQAIDGTAGHWESNFSAAGNYNVVYDWNISAAGDIHFDMHFESDMDSIDYVFNLFSDNSGDITYSLNGSEIFYCEWDSAGHGYYDMPPNPRQYF